MNKKLIIHTFILSFVFQSAIYPMHQYNKNKKFHIMQKIQDAFVNPNINYLYLLIGATGSWALIERYKKNNAIKNIKLLKSEKEELKRDEALLKEINLCFDNLDKEIVKDQVDLKDYLDFLKSKIGSDFASTYYLKNFIKISLNKLLNYKTDLELRIPQWTLNKKKESHLETAKNLYNKIDKYINFLNYSLNAVVVNEKYINLSLLLNNNYEKTYSNEIEAYNNYDQNNYSRSINKHILYLYNNPNKQFPYIEYAQQLDRDRSHIKSILDQYNNCNVLFFEKKLLEKTSLLDRSLKFALDFIVTSENYLNEKKSKPEYDRQQERLRLEVKERESKIEREMQASQAALQKEQNKAKELANKEYELKQAKRELEIKEKEIMYNWAKIRDGETLRENDKNWQRKLDESKDKYNKSLQDYNNVKSELEKVKNEYKKQINDLNSQVNYLNSVINSTNVYAYQQEINRLNTIISNAKSYVSGIEESLNRPPFNPDSVDDLPAYLNTLKNKTQQAQNSLR